MIQNQNHRSDRTTQIDKHLHDIHRDYGLQAAQVGVDEREDADQQNAGHVIEARDEMHRDGSCKQPDSGSQNACDDEDRRGKLAQRHAKALANEIVCRLQITCVVRWNEEDADEQASDEVADGQLQEVEIALVSQARNADECERAGFAGDNRKAN